MTAKNLRVAEEAAVLLQDDGLAELNYITASLEPYSSSQRPDLVYLPNSGRVFVVEMRVDLPVHGRLPTVAALMEHRRFAQEDLGDIYMYFAVATSLDEVPAGYVAALAIEGVEILHPVTSGTELADAVRQWSHRAEVPPWARER